jgi:hypothetical protein
MNELVDLSTGEIIDVAAALSPAERRTKARCDAIIKAGKKHFLRTCRALERYNRLRLYREDYPDFETYVNTEMGISRRRAYQLIAAGLLSTQVHIENERQARELISLPEPVRPLAWELAKDWAKEAAPGKEVPVKFVKAAVSVVVTAIETGGYVDTGNGEMTAIDAALTQEAHESMMRQRQHIRDNGKDNKLDEFEGRLDLARNWLAGLEHKFGWHTRVKIIVYGIDREYPVAFSSEEPAP